MPNYTKAEKAEAIARLREWLKPGDTVYTILEHVSSSGMSRAIRFVIPKVDEDGKPYFLHPNHAIGVVLGLRFHTSRGRKSDALHVSGGGMDMGFDCVYTLSRYLFPDGYDGGYALKQEWL